MSGKSAVCIAGQVELVWLSGEDRLSFLERMSTARLGDLAPGNGRAGCVLTDAGRVVDLLACYAGEDGAALVTSGPGAAAAVARHLKRYVLYADRVRITDASTQVTVLRLLGPNAAPIACQATGLDLTAAAPGAWRRAGDGHDSVWVLRHVAPGGLGGVDVAVPAGAPTLALGARLAAAGASTLDPVGYDALRVRSGFPAYGSEIDGRTNPLELGLRAVVDFGKGCYIGQEVVARLDSYAKVRRRLVGLELAGPAAPGDPVQPSATPPRAGQRGAGRITTAAPAGSPAARWIALALVPATLAAGAQVRVMTATGSVEARVRALPG